MTRIILLLIYIIISINLYSADILILNSYSYSFPQTKEIMNGITDGLQSEQNELNIHIEYMDSRKLKDKKQSQKVFDLIKQKYGSINFNLVVCADIESLRFAILHKNDFFVDTPIVYTGIENIGKNTGINLSNVSGVSEKADYSTLFEFIRKRYKDKELVIICDGTETGITLAQRLGEFSTKKKIKTLYIGSKEKNMSDLLKHIEKFGKKSVYVVGFFSTFENGEKINAEDIIAEMSKEGYNVYGTYKTHLGAGIIGGVLFDRYNQGKKSAELIKNIINDGNINKKRITTEKKILHFDYNFMKKSGITIGDTPLGSKYINYTSFYIKYKSVIDTAILFFIFLSGILIMLVVYLVKTKMLNKEIIENNRFIQIIIDSFPSMLSVIDKDGNIVWANKEFENIFSFGKSSEGESFFELISRSGITGSSIKSYLKDDYNSISEFMPRYGIEEKLRFADGQVRWYYTNKIPLEIKGKKDYLMRLSLDISERKNIEVDLKKAKERAENANESKSRFVANISHEIRTPLNSIIGMADILKHEDLPLNNKKQADIIVKSSERLLALINDILDLSRIEAGVVKVENNTFNIRSEFRKNIDILYSKALKKNIEVIFAVKNNVPEEIVTDKIKYMQIFTNIAANAIKFTTKGYVYITSSYENKNEQDLLKVIIEDTGIGIPDNEKDNIFTKFSRADEKYSSKFEGSGLGLTIAKELTDLLGGEIEFVSQVGVGTKFMFEIPIKVITKKEAEVYGNTAIITYFENKKKSEAVAFAYSDNGPEIYTADSEVEFELLVGELSEENYNIIEVGDFENTKIKSDVNKRINCNYADNKYFDTTMIEKKIHGEEETKKILKIERFNEEIKILVVEDNEFNRETFEAILGKIGDFKVDFAFDGFKALEILEKSVYDIIFSDIQLPGMDGFELAGKIKLNNKLKNIPLIAVTAHAVEGFREMCIRAGMDDYLSKPVTIEKIHLLLKKWMKKYPDDLNSRVEKLRESSELFEKVSGALVKSLNSSCELISTYFASGNIEGLKREAHKIKGATGNIHYEKLTMTIAEMEKYLGKKDIVTSKILFDKIVYEVARIENIIKQYGIKI